MIGRFAAKPDTRARGGGGSSAPARRYSVPVQPRRRNQGDESLHELQRRGRQDRAPIQAQLSFSRRRASAAVGEQSSLEEGLHNGMGFSLADIEDSAQS